MEEGLTMSALTLAQHPGRLHRRRGDHLSTRLLHNASGHAMVWMTTAPSALIPFIYCLLSLSVSSP